MNQKWKDLLLFASILLSMLILVTASFNALSSDGDTVMNGWKAIFGGEVADVGVLGSSKIDFSIGNFLGFFLPLIATIAVFFADKLTKENKILNIIFGAILIIAFIVSLFLLANLPANTKGTVVILGIETGFSFANETSLGLGPILGLIFSILGIAVSGLHTFFKVQK